MDGGSEGEERGMEREEGRERRERDKGGLGMAPVYIRLNSVATCILLYACMLYDIYFWWVQ
jgi:hypothetical protein